MNRRVGYIIDDASMEHQATRPHPESPSRYHIAQQALEISGMLRDGVRVSSRPATLAELRRVHTSGFIAELQRTIEGKQGWFDGDTFFDVGSWRAATYAAGAVCELTKRVMAGDLAAGLAIVRPPGHHASAERAMGFCLLNNIAVAAGAARAMGAQRVAILDWDVHHGNGTQSIFWDDPSILYASVHEYPAFPGTGAPSEIGGAAARGATINVGLPSGARDADWLFALDDVLLPRIRAFAPELLLVSAGFDAYLADPLGGMRVSKAGFAQVALRTRTLADACGGRWVAALEGGYDPDGLRSGLTSLADEMLRAESARTAEPLGQPLPTTYEAIAQTKRALAEAA